MGRDGQQHLYDGPIPRPIPQREPDQISMHIPVSSSFVVRNRLSGDVNNVTETAHSFVNWCFYAISNLYV